MQGLPQFMISGLPDAACKQSPDRIKAAAANSGMSIPNRRLTVNLSPASMPKAGSGFDLPIAIAVLAAAGLVPAEVVAPMVHIGELGLDGSVRPVRGVLPAVLAAARLGVEAVVVPADNAAEAALVPGMTVLPARSARRPGRPLPVAGRGRSARGRPGGGRRAGRPRRRPCPTCVTSSARTRRGSRSRSPRQVGTTCSWSVRRAPARRCWPSGCPVCCPPLEPGHALEVTAIQSLLGVLPRSGALVSRPPFVAPHHGASMAAVIGGGSGFIRPGAISRAHRGVLFLDEAPEFRQSVLAGPAPAGSSPARSPSPGPRAWSATRLGSSWCWPPTRAPADEASAREPTAPAPRGPGATTWASSSGRCSTASTCSSRCTPSAGPRWPSRPARGPTWWPSACCGPARSRPTGWPAHRGRSTPRSPAR